MSGLGEVVNVLVSAWARNKGKPIYDGRVRDTLIGVLLCGPAWRVRAHANQRNTDLGTNPRRASQSVPLRPRCVHVPLWVRAHRASQTDNKQTCRQVLDALINVRPERSERVGRAAGNG